MFDKLFSSLEVDYISDRKEKSLCVSTPTFDYVVKNDGTVYNYRHLQECVIDPELSGGPGANRIWER